MLPVVGSVGNGFVYLFAAAAAAATHALRMCMSQLRSGGATLEANAEALNLKELEYQVSADPLFQKTSASFDEGGAKGMLLNHLAVQSGCQIVFDSSDAVTDDTCVEEESDDNLDMDSLGDVAGGLLLHGSQSTLLAQCAPVAS